MTSNPLSCAIQLSKRNRKIYSPCAVWCREKIWGLSWPCWPPQGLRSQLVWKCVGATALSTLELCTSSRFHFPHSCSKNKFMSQGHHVFWCERETVLRRNEKNTKKQSIETVQSWKYGIVIIQLVSATICAIALDLDIMRALESVWFSFNRPLTVMASIHLEMLIKWNCEMFKMHLHLRYCFFVRGYYNISLYIAHFTKIGADVTITSASFLSSWNEYAEISEQVLTAYDLIHFN